MTDPTTPQTSWLYLERDVPEGRWSTSHTTVDAGWLATARSFIEHNSQTGARVYDPFAGWGTTLLAASQSGRIGLGTEIETARVDAMARRLRDHEHTTQVFCGDAAHVGPAPASVDLLVTSVPYFRNDTDTSFAAQSLYAARDLESYRAQMRAVLDRSAWSMRPGASAVVFVQDVATPERAIPLTAELTLLVAECFDYQGHYIVTYPPRLPRPHERVPRTHETAIMATRAPLSTTLDDYVALAGDIAGAGFDFIVTGSVARALRAPGNSGSMQTPPGDLDIIVSKDLQRLRALCRWLETEGFKIYSWQDAIRADQLEARHLRGRHYLRAGHRARALVVDLCHEAGIAFDMEDPGCSEKIHGLRVARGELQSAKRDEDSPGFPNN